MTTHLVYFYGSTKIITGHNSYSEDSINQRNQIIGINGIDVNPELIEFGKKCFNTPNIKGGIGITGTLYPEKITIMPFFYFYREDLIVRHFEDVIIANENNVKADRIYFPLFHLKIATNEAYSILGNDPHPRRREEELAFKNKWCCFGHYYLELLKKALDNRGYFSAKNSSNLIDVEFNNANGKKVIINAAAGL